MNTTRQLSNVELFHALVSQFHRAFDVASYQNTRKVPGRILELRASLIEEELNEYTDALKRADKLEMLDGLADLAYVIAGTLIVCNLGPIRYTATKPINEYSVAPQANNIIDECYNAMPCHTRMSDYCNTALKRIDDIAYKDFDFSNAFKTVHENNMAKLWPEEDWLKLRETQSPEELFGVRRANGQYLVRNRAGKVIKPLNHTKVNLTQYIKT